MPISCLACWIIGNISNASANLRANLIKQNSLEKIIALENADDFADLEFLSIQVYGWKKMMFFKRVQTAAKNLTP